MLAHAKRFAGLSVIVTFFVGACSEDPPRSSDGVRVTGELILQIGSEDGQDALGRVSDLLVGESEIAIVDQGFSTVRVYDTSGKHLRDFGRSGHGPGEFQTVHHILRHGDTIVLTDISLQRVVRVRNWQVMDSPTTYRNPRIPGGIPEAISADGMVVTTPSRRAGTELTHLPVLVFRKGSERTDTLLLVPLDPSSNVTYTPMANERVYSSNPFARSGLVAIQKEGRFVASIVREPLEGLNPGEAAVTIVGVASRARATQLLATPPARFDKAHAENLIQIRVEALRRAGVSEREVRDSLSVPEYKPAYTSAFWSADDHLWLRGSDSVGVSTWTVLDTTATIQMYVELPTGLRPMHATAKDVWGVERDALSVERVVHYRLTQQRQ